MSSEPPDKPPNLPPNLPPGLPPGLPPSLPPGLPPLNWGQLKADLSQSSTKNTSPLSTLTSPSSSSETAITPTIASSASISDIAMTPTPDSNRSFFFSPRSFFSSGSNGSTTARPLTMPGEIAVEHKYPLTPSSLPSFPISSDLEERAPSFSVHFLRSKSTERDERKKKKDQKKELKRENELTIPSFQEDASEFKDYSSGNKGFLEEQSEKEGFSSLVRNALGADSFAARTSTGLFALALMELDLETKVFITRFGKINISDAAHARTKKRLLDALRLYDRRMSSLLENKEAYQCYKDYMRNIFFNGQKEYNLREILEKIPEYDALDYRIRKIINENVYENIYNKFYSSAEEYKNVFRQKHYVDDLEEELNFYRTLLEKSEQKCEDTQKLRKKISSIDSEIKKERRSLENKDLSSVKRFSQKVKLTKDFFDVFSKLQSDEHGKIPDDISKDMPKDLPKLSSELSWKYILDVTLYFFAALCRVNPKFYGVQMIGKEETLYINKAFFLEFKAIEKTGEVKEFISFMKEKKKLYDEGLLKIVLYKALEYIGENIEITLNHSTIVDEVFTQTKREFSDLDGAPYFSHGKFFFKILSDYVFKEIGSFSPQNAKLHLETLSGPSASCPAPKM